MALNRLEHLANLLIVVTGLTATSIMLHGFITKPAGPPPGRVERLAKGDSIKDDMQVDFAAADRHFVLVLNTRCRFCTASMTFYQRLSDRILAAPRRNIKLVVVGRESVDTLSQYLQQHGVRVDRILTVNSDRYGYTPTLLTVDRQGRVAEARAGQLTAPIEEQVLAQIRPDQQ